MAEDTPYTEILRSVSKDKFHKILSASARKTREVYFARHGIKAPKGTGFIKPGAKNEARAHALQDVLSKNDDHELAEEILRVYLLNRREMLAAALDHLGIEHEGGLTDSEDVAKFETLKGSSLAAMIKALSPVAPPEDIALYLKYMGTDSSEVESAEI